MREHPIHAKVSIFLYSGINEDFVKTLESLYSGHYCRYPIPVLKHSQIRALSPDPTYIYITLMGFFLSHPSNVAMILMQ